MLAPETLLQHRYHIVGELGRGGMGAVYEAVDRRLRRTVALKETLSTTTQMRDALEHEAQLLANLHHPSLPKVLDHFAEGDGQFLVMEFVPGPDLARMITAQRGPFPVAQVLRWADELLDALNYLHGHTPPVVHRDIKPSNLKVSPSGRLVLLDFGLAKGVAGSMTHHTLTQSIAGYSPHYAPLEQIQGEKTSPRSDLYAAAATLYHLLSGKSPVDAITRTTALLSDAPDPLPPAAEINPLVPARISHVLSEALSLKPSGRPASAREMATKLKEENFFQPASPTDGPRRVVPLGPQADAEDETHIAARAGINFNDRAGAHFDNRTDDRHEGGKAVVSHGPHESFAESPRESFAESPRHSPARWIFTGALGLALVAGLVALYYNQQFSGGAGVQTVAGVAAPATLAPRAAVPSPYREALDSVVSLEFYGAGGNSSGRTSGFFIKDDLVAVPLSALKGSIKGSATRAGSNASFDIAGVAAVDRPHGLAALKVNGVQGKPLPVSAEGVSLEGAEVALLAAGPGASEAFNRGSVSAVRGKDDALEINAPADTSRMGTVALNERGEVVALLTGEASPGGAQLAVHAARLLQLVRAKQSLSSLAYAGADKVLHDFRKDAAGDEGDGKNAISESTKHRVLSSVFKSYLTDVSQCSNFESEDLDSDLPGQAREAGYIVPDINGMATGAFTAPGTQQTAYLIFVGECGASHADNWGTKRLAVFQGDRLLVNVDVKDHTGIKSTHDLNSDGVNELLISGGYMQMGYSTMWASLIDVVQGRLRVHKKFNAMSSGCGASSNKEDTEAAVVNYTPMPRGVMPEFRLDTYQARCSSQEPGLAAFKYKSSSKASS